MPETFQRVPRPASPGDAEEVRPVNTVRRNTLTLYISFAAIILSCASAAVNLFTFYGGGQQKMINEADQILTKAEANRVLQEMTKTPGAHQALREELRKLYKNLTYRPSPDAPLNHFERAAFGLMVEAYALPLSEVQLRQVQARTTAATLNIKDAAKGNKELDWNAYGCLVDPALCASTGVAQPQD